MDVGAELARARVHRRLTHAVLAERTNIRVALIEAIERNDFAACGGEVFARGHVRTLAVALDLDPQPMLEAMGAVAAPSAVVPDESERLDIWEMKVRAHIPSEARTWGMVAVLAVTIALGLFWWQRANDTAPVLDPSALPSVTTSATATVTPEPTPTATASSSPTATTSPVASSSAVPADATVLDGAVMLQVVCSETSWVRITNASGTLFQGTMRPGDRRDLASDTDVAVRIGNAAGVSLVVNDVSYGSLGAPGEVYEHTFLVG